MEYSEKNVSNFWSKVEKGPRSKCWPWKNSTRGPMGYGQFVVYRKGKSINTSAHRLAYLFNQGLRLRSSIEGLHIRHTCDNPKCCNPHHLKAGTHQENMDDRSRRMRTAKPSLGYRKLSNEQLAELKIKRSQGYTIQQIATHFKISTSTASRYARE